MPIFAGCFHSLPKHQRVTTNRLQSDLRATHNDLLRAFVGPGADYYLDVAQDFRDGVRYRYHIPAFFLGVLWMLYRKMYAVFFITVLVLTLEQQLEKLGFPQLEKIPAWNVLLNLITASVIGFLANRWYLSHALDKIAEVQALNLPDEQTLAELRRRGGTSWLGPTALLALIVLALLAGAMAE